MLHDGGWLGTGGGVGIVGMVLIILLLLYLPGWKHQAGLDPVNGGAVFGWHGPIDKIIQAMRMLKQLRGRKRNVAI